MLVKYTREIISHHIGPCCVPLASWANAMDQKAIETERTLLAAFPSIGKILSDSHQLCNVLVVCMESLKVIWYSQIISRIFFFTPLAKDWLGSIEMHCNDTPWAHSTIPFIKRNRNHMRGNTTLVLIIFQPRFSFQVKVLSYFTLSPLTYDHKFHPHQNQWPTNGFRQKKQKWAERTMFASLTRI